MCYNGTMNGGYYTKTRGIFNPNSKEPFRVSRSKIDLFLNCPRCFYLDRRLGISQPSGPPFALNSAVDALLKKEFDFHRAQGTPHPLMKTYGINAVPFEHQKMEEWRDALRAGVTYLHKPTNFFVTGGIDDVWVNPNGELLVVDYKATSKKGEVNLDADWQIAYKRQVEVYQWLFRQNGFKVSPTAYFVYCNGTTDREAFDGRLEFDVKVIPYEGSDAWIPKALIALKECLISETLPLSGEMCEFCGYRKAASRVSEAL